VVVPITPLTHRRIGGNVASCTCLQLMGFKVSLFSCRTTSRSRDRELAFQRFQMMEDAERTEVTHSPPTSPPSFFFIAAHYIAINFIMSPNPLYFSLVDRCLAACPPTSRRWPRLHANGQQKAKERAKFRPTNVDH